MNAVLRIVEYPKGGGGINELSIFSIDEFSVDYKAMTIWYRKCTGEQVLKVGHVRVDCTKSPVLITVGNDVPEEE